ncbi:hypothetical protein [Ascidiimonas sp. W6]|uniref:hypothetical protein n=1 Tax=Ascidiimonas meishanensis TaxID=3128903 RepID=UPI0030ECFE48
MLKNLLKSNGVQELNRNEQKKVSGGRIGVPCGIDESTCQANCSGDCVEFACGSGTGGPFIGATSFVCVNIGVQ